MPAKPCVIMDIDGTLSCLDHRLHLMPPAGESWEAFLAAAIDDTPYPEIVTLSNLLAERFPVFLVTGRNDSSEAVTVAWLAKHGIDYDKLIMRRAGDRRPDTVIKKEVLERLRAEGYEPLFAVEDRASVTKMWRENGVRCLQVCEGNY